MTRKNSSAVLRLLAACSLLPLIAACFFRLIDADEGYYLYAARLVGEGQQPYSDFFYPQAPYLPYVWAAWFSVLGRNWFSARALCAVIAIAIAGLIYLGIRRRNGSERSALLAVAIYGVTAPAFCWLTVCKTYGLSALGMTAAFVLACGAATWRNCVLIGLVLGVTVGSRLTIAPAALALLVWALRNEKPLRNLSMIVGAACLALVPAAFVIFRDADAGYFCNLGYHAIRSGSGLVGDLKQKFTVLTTLVGFRPSIYPAGLQMAVLFVANAWILRKRKSHRSLLLWFLVLLLITHLLPTPTFVQYFGILVPFLIIGFAEAIEDFWGFYGGNRRALAVGVAVLAVYLFASGRTFIDYNVTGRNVQGVAGSHKEVDQFRLSSVEGMADLIDAQTDQGTSIAAPWPGFFISTTVALPVEIANHFGLEVGAKLRLEERAAYHLISTEQLKTRVRQRQFSYFVDGVWGVLDNVWGVSWRPVLKEAGYTRHARYRGLELWSSLPANVLQEPLEER